MLKASLNKQPYLRHAHVTAAAQKEAAATIGNVLSM